MIIYVGHDLDVHYMAVCRSVRLSRTGPLGGCVADGSVGRNSGGLAAGLV